MINELFIETAEDLVLNEFADSLEEAASDLISDNGNDIDIIAGIDDDDIGEYKDDEYDGTEDDNEVLYAIPEFYPPVPD